MVESICDICHYHGLLWICDRCGRWACSESPACGHWQDKADGTEEFVCVECAETRKTTT